MKLLDKRDGVSLLTSKKNINRDFRSLRSGLLDYISSPSKKPTDRDEIYQRLWNSLCIKHRFRG